MMLLPRRHFERNTPNRDAKTLYIFCEGNRREPHYFNYFIDFDSRIKVEVIPSEPEGNNSPIGLYNKALSFLITSETNPSPKYELLDIDEVWFVIDTDTWGDLIDKLYENCFSIKNWNIAQSNPCFEVWLYFHFKTETADFATMSISSNWKSYVNASVIPGGFNSKKHPILIGEAIKNSKSCYLEEAGRPKVGCTQVFKLAEEIYKFVEEKINQKLQNS